MKTRYWFDTEFIEDGERILPLSLGMVCEDGRELYVEFHTNRSLANDWVKEHVIPHLGPEHHAIGFAEGSRLIRTFVEYAEHPPEFWGYYCDYDWVLLCQLYGRMVDLPAHWPMFCLDVKQEAYMLGDVELPPQEGVEHHALADARWTRDAQLYVEHLEEMRTGIVRPR